MEDFTDLTPKEQKIIDQLRTNIQQMIDACDSSITPKVCEFRSTPEGRALLAKDIEQRVLHDGDSILEAMIAIEREFNDNLLDD